MTLPDVLATDDPGPLAAGFDPVDDEAWADAVRRASGGRGPETLVRTTLDGLEVAPLYTASDLDPGVPGASPHVRGRAAARPSWTVHVAVDHPDPAVAADRLRVDVEGGAEGAVVDAGLDPSRFADVLGPVLDRLDVVLLRPRRDVAAAAAALAPLAADRARPLAVGLGADPVGLLAASGWSATDPDALVGPVAPLASSLAVPDAVAVRPFTLDATPWSSAGGSDAEIVGLLTAQVVQVLRAQLAVGVTPDAAVDAIGVLLPLDADQFAGLCALRALRRLVDRVASLAGAAPGHHGVRTDVVMAPRIVTRRDPWVNLLRATVVSFVAGVGGADGALVLPYDAGADDTSPLGRRLVRTTQLVLREESRLARVDDPAGGSWYVEERTDRLAEAAWEVVRDVDRRGGLARALGSGWVAERLADTRARRDGLVATRRQPLTGVSEYPDLDEAGLDASSDGVDVAHVPAGATRADAPSDADAAEAPDGAVRVAPLPVARFADAFEALRDASDAHLAVTGARPVVFLATLGPLAEHTARAGFATNLLAAGGITSVVGEGAATAAEAAAAFAASGTSVACVCGTDERYAELAADVVAALREAGATRVLLAGRAPDDSDDAARPDEEIRVGTDAVAVLTRLHADLGTPHAAASTAPAGPTASAAPGSEEGDR